MPAMPFYQEDFTPAGSAMTDVRVERAEADATGFQADQQAQLFQAHLQKGLKGMQEVLTQLPPEVQAQVGDPTPMSASDEARVQWYQGVNQSINRFNMAQSAAQGDQAGVDRASLNDPKAGQAQFDAVTQRSIVSQGMNSPEFPQGKPGAMGAAAPANANITVEPVYAATADTAAKTMEVYRPLMEKYATEFGVPIELVKALATTESRGDSGAISPTGVKGLFQLTRTTAKEMGVDRDSLDGNIKGGIGYLKKMLDRFNGDPQKAFAAYNGGAGVVKAAVAKYGDKWQEHLGEFAQEVTKTDGTVMTPEQKAEEMRGHVNRSMQYATHFSGGAGVPMGEATAPGEPEGPTAQEISEYFLKQGATPEIAKKLADQLGKGGGSDLKAMILAQRQAEEAGRNARSASNLGMRREALEDRNQQKLYDDLVKMEAPVISQLFDDVDTILQPLGGLSNLDAVLPGTDYWDRNVLPLLKGDNAVQMNSTLQRLYSLELKRISGVAVSDAEFKRYSKVFNTGGTNNPEQQTAALKAYIRAYRKQLQLAKSAYGDSTWSKVAIAAGIDPDFLPEVGNAVKGPEGTKEPRTPGSTTAKTGAEKPDDKAAAAKTKYNLDY